MPENKPINNTESFEPISIESNTKLEGDRETGAVRLIRGKTYVFASFDDYIEWSKGLISMEEVERRWRAAASSAPRMSMQISAKTSDSVTIDLVD